jgi:hypothetical protein
VAVRRRRPPWWLRQRDPRAQRSAGSDSHEGLMSVNVASDANARNDLSKSGDPKFRILGCRGNLSPRAGVTGFA